YLTALELSRAAGRDVAELKPPALRALREAGERALALNAYAAAVGLYRSALDLSSADDPARPQLLFAYGKAIFNAEERGEDVLGGENEEAIRVGRQAEAMAEQLGLTEIRVHALTNIGPARVFFGDPGGTADLEEAIAIGTAINSPEALRAYTNLGAAVAFQGD